MAVRTWQVRPRPLLWRLLPLWLGMVVFHLWNAQELFLLFASGIVAAVAVSAGSGLLFARRVELQAAWPATAHAGTVHGITVKVTNTGWLPLPPFSVGVEVPGTAEAAAASAGLLPADESEDVDLELHFRRRGVFKAARLHASFAVLGFLEVRRHWEVPINLVVHPRVWVLAERELGPGSPYASLGMGNLPRPGHDVEFLGVREYSPGDSPRLIHWRTTARRGKFFVKEFARSSRADVTLFADLGAPGPWTEDLAEDLVTGVASVVHLFRDLHLRYQLLVSAERPVHARFGLGTAQYLHAMHVLTQVVAGGGRDAARALGLLVPTLSKPNGLVVFSAFPAAALLDLLSGLFAQGVPVALLSPWLRNLPAGALGEGPTWEPVGEGGRSLPFPVHRFSGAGELKGILAGLR